MNIKKTSLIIFLSLVAFPVFAAQQYPSISELTNIEKNATAAQFIVQFFNLAIAAGALIAVVMIIIAGIEWITSSGNPSKVESAKGKMINTLFGVAVLVGCYFILKTINEKLIEVKITQLECENALIVPVKQTSNEEVKKQCIYGSLSNIETALGGEIQQGAVWKFPENYLLEVYTYSETDFKGQSSKIDCSKGSCQGEITGAKSIYFVLNQPGVYLYDGTNYTPKVKKFPFFATNNISDLAQTSMNFDNFTESIKIVPLNDKDGKPKVNYYSVVFTNQNYKGRCAFVGSSIPNFDSGTTGDTQIGNDAITSVIIAKVNLDEEAVKKYRGEVVLYTKTNCGVADPAGTDIKECHIPVNDGTSKGLQNIEDLCKNEKKKIDLGDGNSFGPDTIQSFEITGDIGIVLSTSWVGEGNEGTRCEYFDKETIKVSGGGACYNTLLNGSSIYTYGGINPKSIIIIPKD